MSEKLNQVAWLAQLVEHGLSERKVVASSPYGSTDFLFQSKQLSTIYLLLGHTDIKSY